MRPQPEPSATDAGTATSRYSPTLLAMWRPSYLLCGAFTGALMGAIVFAALKEDLGADFLAHMGMTRVAVDSGVFPGNPLFYLLNAGLAGFSTGDQALKASLLTILAVATAAKTWASVGVVRWDSGRTARRANLPVWALIGVVSCAVAFSLPGDSDYLGQVPPNAWHNSTVILLMPFAVGLFATSLAYLHTPSSRLLWWSLALVVLNVLVKPSFILCFIPVFPLAVALRYGRSPELWHAVALTVAAGAVLLAQYMYIYVVDPVTESGGAESRVAVDPFHVWSAFSPSIPTSIALSYAFPVAALVLGGDAIRRSVAVRYALALAVVALAHYALFKETGPREFDGNFTWQAIVTNYLLFVALIGASVSWVRERGWTWRHAVAGLAFGAHVVAGVAYLVNAFQAKSFVI